MRVNDYQKAALRTVNNDVRDKLLENGILGLCGESGECADLLKKSLFQGHDLNKEHLAKELGDVAWYLAATSHALGFDLETVFQMNIDKLKNRYPDGFNSDNSLHRVEGDI